ncbi:MAG: 30S ribosomal protein S17 [Candidatus Rariloculaceae bacterium]
MSAEEIQADQPASAAATEGDTGRRVVVGRVVSNKMNQGVSVAVERLIKHPVYGKFIRRTTKVLAHDESNSCNEGDTVAIEECRPISKRKSWRVVKVIETATAS